jgi:putative FmdB family regulatory protein
MAIYSFLCHFCAHEFDEVMSYDQALKPQECPHNCGATAHKLPSLPAPAKGNFGTPHRRATPSAGQQLRFKFDKKEE